MSRVLGSLLVSAWLCAGSGSLAAQQARRKHPRVVYHEQISFPQLSSKIPNHEVRRSSCCTVEYQEPRRAARRSLLRHKLIREFELEY